MTSDFAHAVGEAPQEDGNVSKWKEFLLRPENLATALVLAAGVTSPMNQGQTKLNKVLTSGVGALGYRGGVEKGVEAQRATKREEARTQTELDAEIAAQQAASATARRNAESQARIAGAQEQSVENQLKPRALNPSEIDRNNAYAEYLRANAGKLTAESGAGQYSPIVMQMIEEEVKNKTALGQAPDILGAVQRGMQAEAILGGVGTGEVKFNPDGSVEVSDEFAAKYGIVVPGGSTETTTDEETAPTKSKSKTTPVEELRGAGTVLPGGLEPESARDNALRTMKRRDSFTGMSDDAILDAVAEARFKARDEKLLREMSLAELQELFADFRSVMSAAERERVQRVIRASYRNAVGTRDLNPGGA